jgi:hypothetical protein
VQLYYVLTLIGPELEPEWIERYSVSATLEEAEDPEDAPYIRLAAPLDPNQGPPRPADEPRWQRFERGERLLTAGVVTGSLDVGRMVRAYRGAFRLRSSPRERASVVEHLDDLAALVPSELPLHSELVSALSQLEETSTIHPTTS